MIWLPRQDHSSMTVVSGLMRWWRAAAFHRLLELLRPRAKRLDGIR